MPSTDLPDEVRPEVWDPSVPPGGYVCAVPDERYPGGICGMPVESEPCTEHHPGVANG